jgi:hypothetical protein
MNDLEEKLKSWLSPYPVRAMAPTKVAAIVYACRENIRKLDIDDAERVESIEHAIQTILISLYSIKNYQETGKPFSAKTMRKSFSSLIKFVPSNLYGLHDIKIHLSSLPKDIKENLYQSFIQSDRKRIDHFIELAKRLAQKLDPQEMAFQDAIASIIIHAKIPEELIKMLTDANANLQGQLNLIEYQSSVQRVKNLTTPTDGPKNVLEMIACCEAYIGGISPSDMGIKTKQNLFVMNLFQFMGSLFSELDDMPDQKHEEILTPIRGSIRNVLKTHSIEYGQLTGLIRFFTQHHEGKVDLQTQAYREALIASMLKCIVIDQMYRTDPEMNAKHPELFERNIEWINSMLEDYPRPTPDETADEVIANILKNQPAIKAKRLVDEFKNARDLKPPEMDEVVVLYYPQDQKLRSMRQNFFKYSKLDNDDGPKISFLKYIANNFAEDLKAIGLDEDAIRSMAETGKIPFKPDANQYPLTVEHINDREYGGTNLHDNLILLSRNINENKNKLKTLQLSGIPYKDQGCWIINWVPKKDANNNYPAVFPLCVV